MSGPIFAGGLIMQSIVPLTPDLADTLKYEWRPVNILSPRPPAIYTIYNGIGDDFLFCSVIHHYFPAPMIFVVTPWYSIEAEFSQTGCDTLATRVAEFKSLHPDSRLVFFCNTDKEVTILRSLGIESYFHNQNCLVDENNFYIDREMVCESAYGRFSSVYNAQMLPFKRHELASNVRDLALIYHIFGEEGDKYFNQVRGRLPEAIFCNNISADEGFASRPDFGKYRPLGINEIRKIYNSSGVGLCLSAAEGAMYSSMEYLLCGLPVVSTPALGGRDVYFDPNWALYVDPDRDSVAKAVKSVVTDDADREFIRRSVLERVEDERRKFISRINGIRNDMDRQGLVTLSRVMRYRNGLTGMQPIGILKELFGSGSTC